jgi:hypothetical protein
VARRSGGHGKRQPVGSDLRQDGCAGRLQVISAWPSEDTAVQGNVTTELQSGSALDGGPPGTESQGELRRRSTEVLSRLHGRLGVAFASFQSEGKDGCRCQVKVGVESADRLVLPLAPQGRTDLSVQPPAQSTLVVFANGVRRRLALSGLYGLGEPDFPGSVGHKRLLDLIG